jgi:hypothetical protein
VREFLDSQQFEIASGTTNGLLQGSSQADFLITNAHHTFQSTNAKQSSGGGGGSNNISNATNKPKGNNASNKSAV